MVSPNVSLIEELDDLGTIGRVERFGSNNTRTIHVRSEKLLEWAAFVHANSGSEWIEVAVTPNYPIGAYPKDSEKGIALAPGLYPEDYQKLSEDSDE